MRYNDEGETTELCKWTVDLSSLPTFRENASTMQVNGFYTGTLVCPKCPMTCYERARTRIRTWS